MNIHRVFRFPLTFLSLACAANAERSETHTLYQGTPSSVTWELNKTGFSSNLNGDIYFQIAGQPAVNETRFGQNAFGVRPVFDIPPFDRRGGTRIPTGVSLRFTGNLAGTFHGYTTDRGRDIEGVYRHLRFDLGVRKVSSLVEWNSASKIYTMETGDGGNIDYLTDPASEMAWNANAVAQDEEGKIDRATALAHIAAGGTKVSLGAYLYWFPFYRSGDRHIDAGTNQWSIPDESGNSVSDAYPVDDRGRFITWLAGATPEYPAGYRPDLWQKPGVYSRTGAAQPLSLQVTYYYQEASDADFGADPYAAAAPYVDAFKALDASANHYTGEPATYFAIQGNRFIELGEWMQGTGNWNDDDTNRFGGIWLQWTVTETGQDVDDGNRDAERMFHWADTDEDGRISPAEFVSWRTLIAEAKAKGVPVMEIPVKFFPATDAEFVTKPSPEAMREVVRQIDGGGNGGDGGDPVDPDAGPVEFLFTALDGSQDNLLTQTEWNSIYAVTPKKEAGFAALDSNRDGKVSFTEFSAGLTGRKPLAALKAAVARTEVFLEVDENADNVVSRQEVAVMWMPGAAARTIDSFWSRSKAGAGIGYWSWIKLKSLPSFPTFEKAKTLRAQRSAIADELDEDSDGRITYGEFSKLLKPGTAAKSLDSAWKAAGGSGSSITKVQFIEAPRLPDLARGFNAAKSERGRRLAVTLKLDADQNGLITRDEFSRLYKPGTAVKAIDTGWRAATRTPLKGQPPASITIDQFIEATKLPPLTVY